MLKITKNREHKTMTNIYLTRGDSAYIALTVTDGSDNPIELGPNDHIKCQVRRAPNTGDLLFQGDIIRRPAYGDEPEKFIWWIHPSDTSDVDLEEQKEFYWDAQVEFANSDVFSFIPVSDFVLLSEVSMPNV